MKRIVISLVTIFILSVELAAQSVPVTFHFRPTYTNFTTLRIVGTFNGWNNADEATVMKDDDSDGEYEITLNLAKDVVYNYKYVMDADWGLAWGDPDNPNINVTDNNNSFIQVKDPMITYLLPRDKTTAGDVFIDTSKAGTPIRAIFASSADKPISLSSISVMVDGVAISNPLQYYNADKKEFNYTLPEPLSDGPHRVSASISSSAGFDARTSNFERNTSFVSYFVPVDFYYDENNSFVSFTQDVAKTSVVGSFNNWNDKFNPMTDLNGDGLWQTTALLEEGSYEYKYKLNEFFWINDPDEPAVSENTDNNAFTVKADSLPHIKLITPSEGTIYYLDNSAIVLKSELRPGIKGGGVKKESIAVKLNDVLQSHTFDSESSIVSANLTFAGEGIHKVSVNFENDSSLAATENYTYGIYLNQTGTYYVDAIDDEPYSYPVSVNSGSADILSVKIDELPEHTSLDFTVELEDITDRTRIALIIANPNSNYVADHLLLDIQLPEWQNNGVFASIGAPGNQYENTTLENKLWFNLDNPNAYRALQVNSDAMETNKFQFTVSLAYLDSILLGWISERDFILFSYLAAEDKSGKAFEVTVAENGSASIEDPDVYDAAFMRSGFWQKRMFANYIPQGVKSGPRFLRFDGNHRGKQTLTAKDISDSLASFGPVIQWLTPSAALWYPNVTIHGAINDTEITSADLYANNEMTTISVANGKFEIPFKLNLGENVFYIKAVDAKNFESRSRNLVIEYEEDFSPIATITASVNGRTVTMNAEATSPLNLPLTYSWSRDLANPAPINAISSAKSITFDVPLVNGEYYVNLQVRDFENRKNRVRRYIVSAGDSVYVNSLNDHAAWIDKAIIYEIFPRSFSEQGGFEGIKSKVPQIKLLGVNTVWLMPIYTGPTTHGYEITDYFGFEEDFGTEAQFISMISEFRKAGIKVILDLVINHTSVQHPFMQNAFEYRGYSPWADFYLWEGEPGNSKYEYFFDWASLPNLNFDNPDVYKYFIYVSKYWVARYGIDGYRCDVAWGVQERNQQFWIDWRRELKNIKPEIYLLAEASTNDPVYYQNKFESAYDWNLRNRILETIAGTSSINALDNQLRKAYHVNARPFRFMENHDEQRVTASHNTQKSKLAHTIIFTSNGIPLIYSGGEVGEVTYRDMIDWSDPDTLLPYFQRLTRIRRDYIHNPEINRLANDKPDDIYTYLTVSGENHLLTAANFRESSKTISLDLSNLPFDGTGSYYLTNLIDGTYLEIPSSQRTNFAMSIAGFTADVYYYGKAPIVVSTEEEEIPVVNDYALYQNYPNPFNPTTKIKFAIPNSYNGGHGQLVTLKVFDILGREIQTLVNEYKSAGVHEINFNGSGLASGVYIYRIEAGSFSDMKKFVLIK